MKYAICMLVHKNPALLEKIVERLKAKNTEIFIHLDNKCKLSDYNFIKDITFVKKRMKVYWGGRSMVLAMYNLIDYVINYTDCDYLMFISGEDYPIVLPNKYDEYIDIKNNYIEYQKLPKSDWYMNGINRVKYYYLFRTPKSILSRAFIKMQKILCIVRRYDKVGFDIFGGSQWININRKTAKYILRVWDSYYKFFRFCYIPDEMIFHTIVLNSNLKDTVINNNYRYLRYEENSSNAAYINQKDIHEILSLKYLFCRKINEIIIDNYLGRLNP